MTNRLLIAQISRISVYLAFVAVIIILYPEEMYAADVDIPLRALLEISPHDRVTIDYESLVKGCNLHLLSAERLSQSQLCKLHMLRGQAQLEAGQFDDAIRDFEEATKLCPKDDFEALISLNSALGNKGSAGNRELLQQAIVKARELIQASPNSADAAGYMGAWLLASGNSKACITYFDKSIALNRSKPEFYFFRALAHENNGDFQEALNDLDNCIKLGGYCAGMKGAAGPYVMRALLLMGPFDNTDQALYDLLTAHQIDPSSYRVKYEMWCWYFKQGKYEMAEYISKKLIKEFSKSQTIEIRFATLIQKGLFIDALKLAQEMVSQSPRASNGYFFRGAIHFAKGDYDAAKFDFLISTSINDKNIIHLGAQAYLFSSVALHRNGSAALPIALRCCEQTKYKNPRFIMLLAMAHAAAGHKEEAIKFGNDALGKLKATSYLREDYEKRLKLFKEGKMYDFSPENKVLDYLFY